MGTVREKHVSAGNAAAAAEFSDAVTDAFSALFDGSIHAGYCAHGAATITEAQAHVKGEVLQA
jgi:hypothetical protein